jgi:hypothetical protein
MDLWIELIEETREALATLRVEELEALALRAEREFELADDAREFERTRERSQGGRAATGAVRGGESLRKLAASHRMLREVLEATAGNLSVLQRMRNGGTNSRWER